MSSSTLFLLKGRITKIEGGKGKWWIDASEGCDKVIPAGRKGHTVIDSKQTTGLSFISSPIGYGHVYCNFKMQ